MFDDLQKIQLQPEATEIFYPICNVLFCNSPELH